MTPYSEIAQTKELKRRDKDGKIQDLKTKNANLEQRLAEAETEIRVQKGGNDILAGVLLETQNELSEAMEVIREVAKRTTCHDCDHYNFGGNPYCKFEDKGCVGKWHHYYPSSKTKALAHEFLKKHEVKDVH